MLDCRVRCADLVKELGMELPALAMPVANYVPYKVSGSQLYISGMIPVVDGKPKHRGRLGFGELSIATGQECAQLCVLNALAWVDQALTEVNAELKEVVQIRGAVACIPGFTEHPQVINGASDLLVQIFGEAGKHSRVAIGCASLPLGVPVEIDFLFSLTP
jgi:enamine deaminase RidA (YjgF/YER057c/UK114 family)